MKKLSLLKMMLLLFFVGGATNVMAGETTYTFSSTSWNSDNGAWTSGKDGGNFVAGQGLQVSTNYSGANATSPTSFTGVSKVIVTYNTNKSKGAGSIGIQVGDNDAVTNNVAFSGNADGTSANFTSEFTFDPSQDGKVKITVNCTTNSIYIKSITITADDGGSTLTDPNFSYGTSSFTYDWKSPSDLPTLTYDEQYDGEITYKSSNTNAAKVVDGVVTPLANGSTTITATYTATNTFKGGSVSYELTIVNKPEDIEDGVFDFASGATYGSGLEPTSDGNHYEPNSSDWTAGNVSMTISGKYRWWSNGNTMRLYALGQNDVDVDEGAMEFTVPAGKVITKIEIESNNNSSLEADCGNYSGGTWEGVASRVFLSHIVGGSSVNITKVTVTYEDAPALEVTVGEAGYATLGTTYALDFSNSDIKAYYVSAAADGQLTLTQTNKVAAFEGVLLYKEGGAQEEIPAATEEVTEGDNNDLIAVVKDVENCPSTEESELGTVAFYILNKPEGKEVGFYKANDQKVAAGKAVLMVAEEEAEGAKPFYALGVSAPTGINNAVVEEKVNGVVYNLNGQRVNNSYKGVVIVNGKKVVKK